MNNKLIYKDNYRIFLFLLLLLTGTFTHADSSNDNIFDTEHGKVRATNLLGNLNHPWSLAELPNQEILITERNGGLLRFNPATGSATQIKGLPTFHAQGQGGLLGVTIDMDFSDNHWIYLAYVGKNSDGLSTEVMRAELIDNELVNTTVIFTAMPKSKGGRHFGGRIIQDSQRNLYITLGDRGDRHRAQDLFDHAGSLIRIRPDGSIPADNPWIDQPRIKSQIYTYGNRNIQGITISPDQQQIWMHEHGPQGGDEINVVIPGKNYGWPVITYGKEYVIGTRIGEGTSKRGMQQPVYYWTPSIAPSGMTFYSGKLFPHWQGNILLGSLKFGLLVRLTLKDGEVIHEERMFDGKLGRIRDVAEYSNGSILMLTDSEDGRLIQLTPYNE